MAVSSQQKLILLSRARDNWLNAESIAFAYERALKSAKQRSEWLKIGTILSALLTKMKRKPCRNCQKMLPMLFLPSAPKFKKRGGYKYESFIR